MKVATEMARSGLIYRALLRTFISAAFVLIFSFGAVAQPRVDEQKYFKSNLYPRSTAQCFLLYHVDTNRMVASLNDDYKGPVASLTKMMTCLIADEELSYDAKYRLTYDEAKTLQLIKEPPKRRKDAEKQAEKPKPEELPEVTLAHLNDLAMVPSNNTVCKIIARLIDGGEPAFAARMTRRAKELGMENTLYANASGLPSKSAQYSTAHDQLVLTLELLKRPMLAESMRKHYIWHIERYDSTMYYLKTRYPVTGVKSGWTNAAGRCLVLLVEHPKYGNFILVMLKSSNIAQGFVDAEIILSRFGLIEVDGGSLLRAAILQDEERKKQAGAVKE